MKKLQSLKFRVPFIISAVIAFMMACILITVIFIASKNIKRISEEGYSYTLLGYSSLIDSLLESETVVLRACSYLQSVKNYLANTSDTEMRNYALNMLRDVSKADRYANSIGIMDTNNVVVLDSTSDVLVGRNFKSLYPQAWEALNNNNNEYGYYGTVIKSAINGAWVMFLIAPVIDNNKVIGTVYASINVTTINAEFIESVKVGNTGRLFAVNNVGNAMFHNDPSRINEPGPDILKSIFLHNEDRGSLDYVFNGVDTVIYYDKLVNVPWGLALAVNKSEINETSKMLAFLSSIAGVIIVAVLSIIVFMIIKTMVTGMILLVESDMKRLSEGDISWSVSDNVLSMKNEWGSIAKATDTILKSLNFTVREIKDASGQIEASAKEVALGNTDLSQRTENQAASLEETASSMEEMASTIKASAENSVSGNKMMIESLKSVESAGEIIEATTKSIEDVFEASSKISEITKIIESIALQTNILALNAAVEAARAGEQGRGFAVVASEVRALAQTTQTSVKDISGLIENADEKIKLATESARESKEIFIEIKSKIDETSKIMKEISDTAVEQQSGVDQVNTAVSDMDRATQQNAALVEEATAASEALLDQANNLVEIVSFFKLNENNYKVDQYKENFKGTRNESQSSYKNKNSKDTVVSRAKKDVKNIKYEDVTPKNTTMKSSNGEFGKNVLENNNNKADGFESF